MYIITCWFWLYKELGGIFLFLNSREKSQPLGWMVVVATSQTWMMLRPRLSSQYPPQLLLISNCSWFPVFHW